MNEDQNDIDKLFKDAIDEHTEIPSTGVWEAIDRNLDQKNIRDIQRKNATLKKIIAILLLLLIGGGIYQWQISGMKDNATAISGKNNSINNSSETNNNSENNNSNRSSINPSPNNQTINNATTNTNVSVVESKNKYHIDQNQQLTAGTKQLADNGNSSNNSINKTADDILARKNLFRGKTKGRTKISTTYGAIETIKPEENTDETTNKKDIAEINSDKEVSLSGFRTKIEMESSKINLSNTIATKKNFNITTSDNNIVSKEKSKKRFRPSFSITPYAAYNISTNHLKSDDVPEGNSEKTQIKQTEESPKSYSLGILFGYNFSKHWSVQSGVGVTNTNIEIKPKIIYATTDNTGAVKFRYTCSSGYYYLNAKSTPYPPDSIKTYTASNVLQYTNIPLAIQYNLGLGKFILKPSVGVIANILTQGSVNMQFADGYSREEQNITKIIGLKSSYFSGVVSAGIEYTLSKRIGIDFIPGYNFAITSINSQQTTVKVYPNTLSLTAGIHFKF